MPPSSPLPRRRQAMGLAAWLALCAACAAIGGLASANAPAFYAELRQPAWAPPAWVFGPVWSLLFLAMALAAWLVWRQPQPGGARSFALRLFVLQLGANALWSWLFFAWRLGGPAFAEVLLLWTLIAATLLAFLRLHRAAGLLLLPYLLWVSFAAGLNWVLWRLNPGLLG